MMTWIAQSLAIALGMLVSGQLAGMMSISAELQSFIWLPAGVGLAIALWLGLRALPGIFVGGGVIGWLFAGSQGLDLAPALFVTLGSALGAALEAHIGRLMIRRFINTHAEIESGSDLLILLLIAPVAALVSPSIAVVVQSLGEVGLWDDYAVFWRNLWLADAVAMAALTPLLLALRRRTTLQIAVLGSILIVGTWVSYRLVISTSNQARTAWETMARDEANQLTGLFMRALQNGYGDMRAVAVLLRGKDSLDQAEFQEAVETLHDNSDGFVPAALLVVTRDVSGDWIVELSSDTRFGLVRGFNMSTIDVARDAIEASLEHGLVLGATTELLPGRYYGMNAIPVAGREETTVVVGVQDVGEIDGIVAAQIHHGLGFAISSVHASGLTTEGRDHLYPNGKSSKDALASFNIPISTAGATLNFHWGVVEEYLGGPKLEFSRAIFFGGPLVTLLVALSINMLFAQAGRIRRQVAAQTAELRSQREIVQLTMDSMDQALLMVGSDSEIVAYNQLYLELFGIDDEAIRTHDKFTDLIQHVANRLGDSNMAEERIREAQRRDAFTSEQETPDGRIIETRHNRVSGGGFVRTYTDVTEARQAAREVERQKTIATQALENMGEGILVVDAEGRVAAYNQLAADYFGLTREEVDRYPDYVDLLHFIHTEKHDMPEQLQQRLRELEHNVPSVTDRLLPDGTMLEVRHRPVEAGGFVRIFLDVTEIRKAEEELRRQKSISELALANMDNGLLLVDGDWKVAAYNPVALNLFGLTVEEIAVYPQYEDLMRYIHREKLKRPELAEERLAQVRRGEPFTDEQHLNDGTIIEVRHYPMEDGGFLRMMDDVTERRANEQKLIEAMNLAEESARSKSDFLANMSHEIRTPMNAIIGMSHLALKTSLSPKQHNYVDKVHRSAVGLLGIINDILDFSKIEAGKLELETIEFRLEDVLDNLANLVGLRAEEKGLELLLHVEPTVPRYLVGDPLRLGQVLVNLGNNAVKFTDTGEVVVSICVLEQADDLVKLAFSVRDTGIGMTAEQQERLFQAFSQADASTTRKYGGTGLGLTISQRLVDAMQGEISVESEVDRGSDFRFTVELGWKPEPEALPCAADLELDELRVLVVDDNPTARTILQDLVASLGFRVDMAASGNEALALAASALKAGDSYSVVLMDWQMPGMDGVKTTRLLVDEGLHSSTQTLLMVTAYGREEAAAAGSGLPINSYLTKPVNASILLDSILLAQGREAVSHRRRQLSEESGEMTRKLAGAYVLLVEDNEINQELALGLLTGAGMVVDVAGDGRQALEKLAENDYDGVLMDVQMPVMDGYTATEAIRRQDRFRDLPVLAMTANALVGDRERALEAGMNDHIAKPLNVGDMFATMAMWITPADPTRRPAIADEVETRVGASGVPELEGIDTRAGLAACAGNVELYRKLLKKFLQANSNFESGFHESRCDGTETATRLVHTLKGTAGNIGARDVAAGAASLETACREEQADAVVNARLQSLLAQLVPVLEAIAAADLEPKAKTVQVETGNILALFSELRALLESSDTQAGEVVEQLQSALGDHAGDALNPLISHIEMFDFDAALSQLGEVESRLS